MVLNHVLKTLNVVKKPLMTILVLDSDDTDPNNVPDGRNNHRDAGLNIGFLDGHVTFTKPGALTNTYLRGHQFPPFGWNVEGSATYTPGLQQGTDSAGNTWYHW